MELWIGIRGKYRLPIFAVEYVVLVMVPTNVNIPPGQERRSLFRSPTFATPGFRPWQIRPGGWAHDKCLHDQGRGGLVTWRPLLR